VIADLKGTVVSMGEGKTAKGKPYRVVQLLQQGEKSASLVRVKLWNGTKVEVGKPLAVTAVVDAFTGSRGGALLSVDVF
jgi:hypothetical protein